ncbi:hypothetical protein CALCODRAFT_246238 [Calocera cornea HHB12733]|uniref:Secreted protein n=1 Tax=Calocera cornea HHB12733 TaxID=1353952 RepID=A0A165JUN6_9BASI|nr:hypothetical protein CALCODRAFT_246238 [Calocera cornea HHB12733]
MGCDCCRLRFLVGWLSSTGCVPLVTSERNTILTKSHTVLCYWFACTLHYNNGMNASEAHACQDHLYCIGITTQGTCKPILHFSHYGFLVLLVQGDGCTDDRKGMGKWLGSCNGVQQVAVGFLALGGCRL